MLLQEVDIDLIRIGLLVAQSTCLADRLNQRQRFYIERNCRIEAEDVLIEGSKRGERGRFVGDKMPSFGRMKMFSRRSCTTTTWGSIARFAAEQRPPAGFPVGTLGGGNLAPVGNVDAALLVNGLRRQINEVARTRACDRCGREQSARCGLGDRNIEHIAHTYDLSRLGALIGEFALKRDQIGLR
jgi:hypothetical protein